VSSSNNKNKQELYLTYLGLSKLLFSSRSKIAHTFQKWATKLLFSSRSKIAHTFQKWATKLLFTVQLGTD
jgi:prophage antirepressor-like protein